MQSVSGAIVVTGFMILFERRGMVFECWRLLTGDWRLATAGWWRGGGPVAGSGRLFFDILAG